MAEAPPAYVLDSLALRAYYQAEPGAIAVLELLQTARDSRTILYLSLINAGELYYLIYRQRGSTAAQELLENLRELPITLVNATEDRIFAAAQLKAEYRISYADTFAAALAR